MMRMGRPRFGIGMVLVAAVLMTGVFRSGGPTASAIPTSVGSIQLVVLAIIAFGIVILATNNRIDRSLQSPFETNGPADTEDALEALKRRYANGAIDETEFERKLEMLFETETVAHAERRVETQSVATERRSPEEPVSDGEGTHRPPVERQPNRQRPRSRRGRC